MGAKGKPIRMPRDFKAGCYYAVREEFNATNDPGFVDRTFDALIRAAIGYLERMAPRRSARFEISLIEVDALAHCGRRRGLDLKCIKWV